MKKRLSIKLTFEEADYPEELIKQLAALAKQKAVVINEGLTFEEPPVMRVHDCNHDTGRPCENEVNLLD